MAVLPPLPTGQVPRSAYLGENILRIWQFSWLKSYKLELKSSKTVGNKRGRKNLWYKKEDQKLRDKLYCNTWMTLNCTGPEINSKRSTENNTEEAYSAFRSCLAVRIWRQGLGVREAWPRLWGTHWNLTMTAL